MSKSKKRWCPDVCPFTGEPFFGWVGGPNKGDGMVPIYGNPYTCYTIPEPCDDESDYGTGTKQLVRYVFDHDVGGWRVGEVERLDVVLVDDERLGDLLEAESDLSEIKASLKGRTP